MQIVHVDTWGRGMGRRQGGADEAAAAPGSVPVPAAEAGGASAAGGDVQLLLRRWQATADHTLLKRLLEAVTPVVQDVARRILARNGFRDPGAVDDTVSLVFDHLRRLAPGDAAEQRVAPFEANRVHPRAAGDAGIAYVAWLTRERALDVVRRLHRQNRRCRHLEDADAAILQASHSSTADSAEWTARLHEAIARLTPRDRKICEHLLAGHSQATIAGLLGLSAGTVSRLRQRAISVLRDAIAAS